MRCMQDGHYAGCSVHGKSTTIASITSVTLFFSSERESLPGVGAALVPHPELLERCGRALKCNV